MCGIVGLVTRHSNGFSQPEVNAFNAMLWLSTFRGFDSTGVFTADTEGNVLITKEASMAPVFMTKPEYKAYSSKLFSSGKFAVGHTRAATKGAVNDQNAHPFWVEDKIVLVQNGTWWGDHKKIKDTEVDSEAVAHIIAETEDPVEAIQKIEAAYALVWFNIQQNKLNFVRNSMRPLNVAYTKGGIMLFASEKETIDYAVAKAGWKYDKEPYELIENNLYTITFKKGEGDYTTENIKIPGKVHAVTNYGGAAGAYPFPTKVTDRGWTGNSRKYTNGIIDCVSNEAYFLSLEEKAESLAYFHQWEHNAKTKDLLIELEDYVAVDETLSRFWVYGRILTPDGDADPLSKLLIYWMVEDITESAIINYVSNGYYQVQYQFFTVYKLVEGYVIAVRVRRPVSITNVEPENVTKSH